MTFQDIALSKHRTALIVVDMEHEFCRPEGQYYLGPEVSDVIERAAALIARCRQEGIPVIYVRSVRYPDDPVFTRFGRDHYLIEGTKGPVILEELAPLPGDPVIDKHTHDCFYNTGMDSLLRRMAIDPETHHVIVTGVMSNVCVYHAAIGFHVRHYCTVLPMDCTIGSPGGNDFVIAQLSMPAYAYNTSITTSDRITFTG